MTKLFSMKTLAFAGAAAFALTLAAAPKADAASVYLDEYEYENPLSAVYVEAEDGELTETEDGYVIYYQLAKDSASIKAGKYIAITDENLGFYNLSSLSGKGKYLSLSIDGTKEKEFAGFMLKKAPKIKIKHQGGETKLSINNSEAKLYKYVWDDEDKGDKEKRKSVLVTQGGITAEAGGVTYDLEGMEPNIVKTAGVLGATLSVTVNTPIKYKTENGKETEIIEEVTAPATAKYRIPAKAKAPKVSLKLDAAKAFEWNLSSKQEYMISCESKEIKTGWKDGSKGSWESIFKGAGVLDDKVKEIVSGDAITANVDISVRIKATNNKAASAINLVKLKKSAASPTTTAITVETTKASNWDQKKNKWKTATGASIKAVVDVQYSVDGGKKWKALKASKTVKLKVTEKEALVRIVTPAKKGIVLPSLNTKVTWDPETGKANTVAFDYDENGAVKALPAENIEAK